MLSTCNRCELYWSGKEDLEPWFRQVAKGRGQPPCLSSSGTSGLEAVRHLFIGNSRPGFADSGRNRDPGPGPAAYDAARAAGTTTREMELILSAALAAGRRVRCETMLAATRLRSARRRSTSLPIAGERSGPGKWSCSVPARRPKESCAPFIELGASRVTLLNRRPVRGQVLAEAWGATSAAWEQLGQKLESADLLLVATAGSRPVVSAAQLSQAILSRSDRELFVMDLSVPRNVEPAARDIPGVHLFDLDDLQRLCCPAAGAPSAALDDAHQVIEEELARLGLSLRGKAVAGRLAELHRLGIELAEQESAWALDRLESLSETDRDVVRQMADRLVRRVLYPVSRESSFRTVRA